MTTSYKYCLNFTDKTKIRPVDMKLCFIIPIFLLILRLFFQIVTNLKLWSVSFRLSLSNFIKHNDMI